MTALEDSLVSAGLVLVGFFLNAGWQAFTGWRSRRAERKRILIMLGFEINQNTAQANEYRDSLKTAPTHGMMNLAEMNTNGWIIVASNWALLKLPFDVARTIGEMYQQARQINEGLRMRQAFSTTMIALTNYKQILSMLDSAIAKDFDRYIAQSDSLRPSLAKLIEGQKI